MNEFMDDGELPQLTTLTPEEQRIADLEYRLARQEYQIKLIGHLSKRLEVALKLLAVEQELSAEADAYVAQLHKAIARLGVRGEAAFTKDGCLTLSLKITDEVIVSARTGLRHLLAYHFAEMQAEIERKIAKRP